MTRMWKGSPERLRLGILATATLLVLAAPATASANDYVVYSPRVVQGQNEVEARGFYDQDSSPSRGGSSEYDVSFAHAFTSWWKPEIYLLRGVRTPGSGNHLAGYEFENTFQLAPEGEFPVTPGFLLSYEANTQTGKADVVEFGPLLERQDGRFTQRLNLIWERQVGGGASGKPGFRTAYSLSYRYTALLQPAVEIYLRPTDHSYQAGPLLDGEWTAPTGREIEYNIGAVFGANADAPSVTWLARVEYEFF